MWWEVVRFINLMLNYTCSDAPPKGHIWLQTVGCRRWVQVYRADFPYPLPPGLTPPNSSMEESSSESGARWPAIGCTANTKHDGACMVVAGVSPAMAYIPLGDDGNAGCINTSAIVYAVE